MPTVYLPTQFFNRVDTQAAAVKKKKETKTKKHVASICTEKKHNGRVRERKEGEKEGERGCIEWEKRKRKRENKKGKSNRKKKISVKSKGGGGK